MNSESSSDSDESKLSYQTLSGKRMQIQGHRGGYKPENTMKSFTQALDQGLSGIELDVMLFTWNKCIGLANERWGARYPSRRRQRGTQSSLPFDQRSHLHFRCHVRDSLILWFWRRRKGASTRNANITGRKTHVRQHRGQKPAWLPSSLEIQLSGEHSKSLWFDPSLWNLRALLRVILWPWVA